MPEYLAVKNWEKFQHYKHRNPPWIKLEVVLLSKRNFTALALANRGLLMLLWVLASKHEGKVKDDLEEIRYQLRDNTIKQKDINLLIDKGFLIRCKQVLADAHKCYPETETEIETDICRNGFDEFWKTYPRKIGKGAARKAWKKLKPSKDLQVTILKSVKDHENSDQWKKEGGRYIPNPATFINQERWSDVVQITEKARDEPIVRDTQDPVAKKLIREFAEKHTLKNREPKF